MRHADQPARTQPNEKRAILHNDGLKIVNDNFWTCDWSLKIVCLSSMIVKEDLGILPWTLSSIDN